jgi:cytochrome b6-f complex iron-sulfur subunit
MNQDQVSGSARRGFMKALLGFSVFATLGGVLTPIIGYLIPPARQSGVEGTKVRATSLSELRAAGGMVVPVENQAVVLTISREGAVNAFSAICTHLGCVSKWDQQGGYIHCPCHDGRFNAQTGDVISGPPPSPLPRRTVVVEDDDIFVVI